MHNSIRGLNIIAILFLGLDLTIDLIHVIAQQIQKFRTCIVAWRKVLPTEKSLVTSFGPFFQISQQPRRIRKNRDKQKFLLMQGYLSKVKLHFLVSPLKRNFLTNQGIALGVEFTTSKGRKLQPPLKVVLTTLLFTMKSGLD